MNGLDEVVSELYAGTRPRMVRVLRATLDDGSTVSIPGGSTREEIIALVYEAIDAQKATGTEGQPGACHSDQMPPPNQGKDHARAI